MRTLVAFSVLAGLLLSPAMAVAQLSAFSEDFEGLSAGDFGGTANLLRRNPSDFTPPRDNTDYAWEVQVASESGNQYLEWNTTPPGGLTTDAHVLVAGSNTTAQDYNFDLKLQMRSAFPLAGVPGSGFNWLIQWQYLQDADQDPGTAPLVRTIQFGRTANGGLRPGSNSGAVGLATIERAPWLVGDQVGESGMGDYAQWANVRIQKLGDLLRYKVWGVGVEEPAWESTYASAATIPDYVGPAVTQPSDYTTPNVVPEQGIRFKWAAGLAIDDVQVALPLDGDANGDGAVDLADLAVVATNWNVTEGTTWLDGDFTGDAAVDLADLAALATNWNQTGDGYPLASALGALGLPVVPEPATLSILSIGALAFFRRRR